MIVHIMLEKPVDTSLLVDCPYLFPIINSMFEVGGLTNSMITAVLCNALCCERREKGCPFFNQYGQEKPRNLKS